MPEIPEKVIMERLNTFIKQNTIDHKEIIDQVTKTNGSVANIQRWRYMVTGALIIMNIFFVPIVVAILAKAIIGFLF